MTQSSKLFLSRSFEVSEKVDGRFCISYWDDDGTLQLASKGSFTSPEAVKAAKLFEQLAVAPDLLNRRYTYMFEVVYPAGKIMVDYGSVEELVLLSVVSTETGEELDAAQLSVIATTLGVRVPERVEFSSWQELLEAQQTLDKNSEGFVVKIVSDDPSDPYHGKRVKIKGEKYMEALAEAKGFSRRLVVNALKVGGLVAVETLKQKMPEEFHPKIEAIVLRYEQEAAVLKEQIEHKLKELDRDQKLSNLSGSEKDKYIFAWITDHFEKNIQHIALSVYKKHSINWYKAIEKANLIPLHTL